MVDELHPPRWDLGWLALTQRANGLFPSVARRRRRIARALCQGRAKGYEHRVYQALMPLWTGAEAPELPRLLDSIEAASPVHGGRVVIPLRLVLRVIDAARRRLSPDPLAHALEVMGFAQVPAALVGLTIEVGLATRMSPPKASQGGHSWSGYFRWTPTPMKKSPAETKARRRLDHIAAIAELLLDAKVLRPWHLDPEDEGSGLGDVHELAEPSTYLLHMLERLPRRDPRCLVIYERFADSVEPRHREAAERATETFIDGIGQPQLRPKLRLRAALRRLALGDDLGTARERAAEAYHGMLDEQTRRGACLAACAAARATVPGDDDADRIAWLERAWELADGIEAPSLRAALLHDLFEAYDRDGDPSGQVSTMLRIEALVDEHGVLAPLGQLSAVSMGLPTHGAEPRPGRLPRRFLDQVVERSDVEAVDHALSEYVADLLEHCDEADVVQRLQELLDAAHGRPVASLLAEALADLCEDDFARWSAYKDTQLRLEDRERRGDGTPARAALLRRVAQCTAEAEAAFAAGALDRAKFWVRHAERYRVDLEHVG